MEYAARNLHFMMSTFRDFHATIALTSHFTVLKDLQAAATGHASERNMSRMYQQPLCPTIFDSGITESSIFRHSISPFRTACMHSVASTVKFGYTFALHFVPSVWKRVSFNAVRGPIVSKPKKDEEKKHMMSGDSWLV